MLPKYSVSFVPQLRKHTQLNRFNTDDPVTLHQFVEELLETGAFLESIHHEGVPLNAHEFDRVVKTAAGMLASKRLCTSLRIKPEEEKFRFGFAG